MAGGRLLTIRRLLKNNRQLRSRIAQRFNVRDKVRFDSSLAAALLNGLFQQPTRDIKVSASRCSAF